MYIDGSNALKTEYFTYDAPHVQGKRKTATKKASAKASANKVRAMKKRVVAAMLLAFAMTFLVLFRYATITAEYSKLSRTKEELELINAMVVEKQVQASGNLDPKKIEQEAARLGLKPPAQNQIKYISLGNTDNGEVLKTEEISAFSAFINRVSVILEYLY